MLKYILNYKFFYKNLINLAYASFAYGYEKEVNENLKYIIVDATLDLSLLNFCK